MSHAMLQEMLAESGLDAEEMNDVVAALAPLAGPMDEAPAPSAELAALFGPRHGDSVVSQLSGRRRAAVAGALVLAISGVGATGLSAAANTLPRPIQHEVSKFSRHYLPFDLPEPPAPANRELPLSGSALPLPGNTRLDDGDTMSRSAQARPGAPAGASTETVDAGHTAQAHPQPSASPSVAPSSTASLEPMAISSPRPSASGSHSPSQDEDEDEDESSSSGGGKDRPGKSTPAIHPEEQKPGKGSGKPGKPGKEEPGKNPGNGHIKPGDVPSELPVPGQGQDPVEEPNDSGETVPATPTPDLPLPPLPLPDPVPGLDVIVDGGSATGN